MTVMTSVDVEVVGVPVVDDEVVGLAGVLDTSGYSTTLVAEVVSVTGSDNGGAALAESSEVLEVVLRNLCMLTYLERST